MGAALTLKVTAAAPSGRADPSGRASQAQAQAYKDTAARKLQVGERGF